MKTAGQRCQRLIRSLFLLCFCACTGTQSDSARPNILFIMADDHTAQAWGLYGGVLEAYAQTPSIRRLAQEGVVLDRAFCTNSICTPSRASILTGQYSHQNDVYTLSEALDPDSMNVARVLQANGYQTAVIGKWHLKKEPAGFDHYMVLPGQGRYHDPILKTADNWQDANQGGRAYQGFSADVIGDFSIDWLKDRDPAKPFFLMVHFKATHEPFVYPERYDTLYADVEIPEPASLYDFSPRTNGRSWAGQQLWILGQRYEQATQRMHSGQKPRYPGLPFSLDGLDSLQARKKTYQKFVKDFLRSGAAIDDNVGKLLAYLDHAGLAENTVVIYTADQGYFLGEHGMFDKRMIYEEALRMPYVMRYPPEIPSGSRNDDIILNIDFPSLFADYAGLALQPGFLQGRSFRDNVRGHTPPDWRTRMYYRYWLHQTNRPAHFGVRNERYKLAFFYGQPLGKPGAHTQPTTPAWEFYDLEADPHEDRNAYADPAYAEIIRAMKQELRQLRQETGDTDEAEAVMQQILDEYW